MFSVEKCEEMLRIPVYRQECLKNNPKDNPSDEVKVTQPALTQIKIETSETKPLLIKSKGMFNKYLKIIYTTLNS